MKNFIGETSIQIQKSVDLIFTSKGLNRHKSSKASKRLGMKNLAGETSLWDEKSSRWNFHPNTKNLLIWSLSVKA
jgi:hypothetical protein